jgi:cytochrome c556
MRKLNTLLCIALIACFITAAYAQFAKPEDAIGYRKAVMTIIAHHFGLMAAVVKGQQPYKRDEFMSNAVLVETFSKLPWEAFLVPGTDKGETKLKPEAFKEPSKFREDGNKFEAQAAKLVSAANSSNLDTIKNQFGEVATSCQQCHKQFRAR